LLGEAIDHITRDLHEVAAFAVELEAASSAP
jgi:hypothetical protein